MKVRADLALCVGHGRCYALCPDIFHEDDEGHVVVAREDVPAELVEKARMAVENCPEEALSIED